MEINVLGHCCPSHSYNIDDGMEQPTTRRFSMTLDVPVNQGMSPGSISLLPCWGHHASVQLWALPPEINSGPYV